MKRSEKALLKKLLAGPSEATPFAIAPLVNCWGNGWIEDCEAPKLTSLRWIRITEKGRQALEEAQSDD
jgi:DNA mismatch repair protein MutH